MSNIDKQAVTAKTKELASFMVERFSMNPVSCKLLNEAWKKEFPDEVAIAERMLALLDELEHYKSREERVTKLVLDNSTSWDALYKKLEAANRRSAELDRDCWTYENTVKTLLERAESAESACTEAARILKSGERMALTRAVNILLSVGEDAAPYRYPVVLPEPLGFKPPSGRDVLLKNDVIAALMSAGVPVERG
ncbi:ead/Ea22-like family protein [Salmonella enterica]|uniref:Ead/Ea22-like family protein n=2 Tax=Salmonella enterica I TaxID=59201 RepID=A0A5A8I5S6_SALIN|nr:ead/Ea22-like family protein [Salmonella enterica]EAA4015444.1 ead/Ea22-like family protein [Salmonella enterica subsp. enterica serovar Newport]EBS0125604.1 ead/Ea22-like family protein [Salmonella enterica subsp. enterica serovar Javiana]EBW1606037.1 ead/Ea22-like family protein [Salmonella enterica subsp. enterica serovar Livingstone]EBX9145347.1 ead/Ea22-like family protein [Salmonella enterica subsp. enterica serovar Hvittingfoss]ECH7997547.1 ead/Ea22-like family protein [Salmonella en